MNPEISDLEANLHNFLTLLGRRDWVSAAAATDLLSLDDRYVRKLAQASGGQIGSGQDGYKLVTKMTDEEFSHFRLALLSQADHMRARVDECDTVRANRGPDDVPVSSHLAPSLP